MTSHLVDMATSIYGAMRSDYVGSIGSQTITRGVPLSVQSSRVAFGDVAVADVAEVDNDGGPLMMLARVRAVIRHLERDGRGSAERATDATAETASVSKPKRPGDAFWTALQEIDLTQPARTSDGSVTALRDRDTMSPRR